MAYSGQFYNASSQYIHKCIMIFKPALSCHFLCKYATIQLLDELPLGEFCVRKEFSIMDHTYQRPLQLPACCSVLSAEEMTYTEGGALSINITPEQVMAFGINATVNLLGMMGRYAFQAAVSGCRMP